MRKLIGGVVLTALWCSFSASGEELSEDMKQQRFAACENFKSYVRQDHEAYCNCVADKTAEYYAANPNSPEIARRNRRYISDLGRKAMVECSSEMPPAVPPPPPDEKIAFEKQIESASTVQDLSSLRARGAKDGEVDMYIRYRPDAAQWISLRERMRAKIHALATAFAAQELAAFRTLENSGDSPAILKKLTERDAEITHRYGVLLEMPEFAELNRELTDHRQKVRAHYASVLPKTNGMTYASAIDLIASGQFDEVPFSTPLQGDFRTDDVPALVEGYVNAFWERCKASLPADKVELTKSQCVPGHTMVKKRQVSGVWMEVPGSEYCTQYEQVRTGKFADPDVGGLYVDLYNIETTPGSMLKELMKGVAAGQHPLDQVASKAELFSSVQRDMQQLLALNGCTSDATRRFQLNLVRFGRARPPIAVDEALPSRTSTTSVKETIMPMNAGDKTVNGIYEPGFGFGDCMTTRNCQGNQEPVFKMLYTPDHQDGPMLLRCDYETPTGAHDLYFFWSKAPPANIQAMLAVDKHGVLRYLGTKGLSKCPATKEGAEQRRRAADAETKNYVCKPDVAGACR